MWNKMMEEKAGVERQNSKKDFKASLSSDRSKSEKQKSQTRCWGSLAMVMTVCDFSALLSHMLITSFFSVQPTSPSPDFLEIPNVCLISKCLP